jgi:hypothetical protein
MDTSVDLPSEADRLVSLVDAENPFDYDYNELAPRLLKAIDQRFQERRWQIKLVQNRAETGRVEVIRQMADIVPLLFAHTAYKSYPEAWLMEKKWERLGRWLDTISTNRVPSIDTANVQGLDDWLERLGEVGHFVSCSSGTTGKCSMMNATADDLAFCGHSALNLLAWCGVKPNRDRRLIGPGLVASSPRNHATRAPVWEGLSRPDARPFAADAPPMTIGRITDMVVLRKRIAEGAATPSETAHYEAETAARQKTMDSVIEQTADAYIAHRAEKLHVTGQFGSLYRVVELIRARGYSGKDFNPENSIHVSGGLKRAQVPADYREVIFETFNIQPEHLSLSYGMQEQNTSWPRCRSGRYHMPPWVMLLLLDEGGDNLVEPTTDGEVEGRAGFFDLSLQGRWGGVISGDKVRATWAPCACGNRSPSIADQIERYADMASGDKITCAGTIDAYVRGIS